MPDVISTTAIIVLAGGLGSRLGSNKPLQRIAGKPLISHVIQRLAGVSDECIVVIARHASRNDYLEILPDFVRVMNDEREEKSPLVGMVTALRATESHYVVVLTCDVPFVNRQVVQLLMLRAPEADAVIPKWNSGQLEPLHAAYRTEPTLRESEKALTAGNLSPIEVISSLPKVAYISIEDEIRVLDPELRTFFNVNTRPDLTEAEMILKQGVRGTP